MKTKIKLDKGDHEITIEAPYTTDELAENAAIRYSFLIPLGATVTGEEFAALIKSHYDVGNPVVEVEHAAARQFIKSITHKLGGGVHWTI